MSNYVPVEKTPPPLFRSKDVARMHGVSLRQLQWWGERRVIQPTHEGHHRVFSVQDAVMVGIVTQLRLKGISLQRVRRVLKGVSRDVEQMRAARELDGWCLTVPANLGSHHVTSERGTIEMAVAAKGLVAIVSISEQIRKVEAHVTASRERKTFRK